MRVILTIADKMYQMGWDDAIEGRDPRFSTKNYMDGYRQGKNDIGEDE